MGIYKNGSDLQSADQKEVLAAYVHRYTKDHKPAWVQTDYYKPQFANDEDWLNNTIFHVRKNGRLDHRFTSCCSTPTWPDGKYK